MATLLDTGFLSYFGAGFMAMFAFALLFGVLEVTAPFGKDKKGLHALLAIVVAFLLLMSKSASGIIKTVVPWFIVLVVFTFFVMLLFRMFGVDDNQFKKVITDANVYIWIIIFSILVLFGGLSAIFGQTLLDKGEGISPSSPQEMVLGPDGTYVPAPNYDSTSSGTTTGSFTTNMVNTIRNPKILGMVFIFLTGAFMMIFLTKPSYA